MLLSALPYSAAIGIDSSVLSADFVLSFEESAAGKPDLPDLPEIRWLKLVENAFVPVLEASVKLFDKNEDLKTTVSGRKGSKCLPV